MRRCLGVGVVRRGRCSRSLLLRRGRGWRGLWRAWWSWWGGAFGHGWWLGDGGGREWGEFAGCGVCVDGLVGDAGDVGPGWEAPAVGDASKADGGCVEVFEAEAAAPGVGGDEQAEDLWRLGDEGGGADVDDAEAAVVTG